jgi:Superinfection immunity protein
MTCPTKGNGTAGTGSVPTRSLPKRGVRWKRDYQRSIARFLTTANFNRNHTPEEPHDESLESAMSTPGQDVPWPFDEVLQIENLPEFMLMDYGKVDFAGLVDLFVALFVLILYFVPTIIAHMRDVKAYAKIFFVNLFLGWTLIGWIAALIWSFRAKPFFGRRNRRDRGHLRVSAGHRPKKPYYDLREENVVELENEQLRIGKN